MAEPRQKRFRSGAAGLLDVAYIFAAQKTNFRMSWPRETGMILSLCRNVDSRVLEQLCTLVHEAILGNCTRLGHAASTGDDARVAMLLDLGAPVDAGTPSALAWAVGCAQPAAARRLLSSGASIPRCLGDLARYRPRDTSALDDSRIAARSALIEELCADPSAGISKFNTVCLGVSYSMPSFVALHLDGAEASESEMSLDQLRDWLEDGVDWSTPAAKSIMLLLAARPSIFDFHRWFGIAGHLGDRRLVRDLCALTPVFDASEALFAACGVEDLELVKSLLVRDSVADRIVFFDSDEMFWSIYGSSVVVAAQMGHADVVHYVLHWLRSRPDRADPAQSLLAAVGSGLLPQAIELIRGGVSLKMLAPDVDNALYLCVACYHADVDMVRMLLSEGADPNLKHVLTQPLVIATSPKWGSMYPWKHRPAWSVKGTLNQREEIVRLLIAAGAVLEDVSDAYSWKVDEHAAACAFISKATSGVPGGDRR